MRTIFLFLVASVLLAGCKKEDPIGPTLTDLYGEFEVYEELSADDASVDFEAGDTVQFKGRWSLITPWTITVTGKTSGAVKTISGKSRTVDTTLGLWDGTADGRFFKEEECLAVLSFTNYTDTFATSLSIVGLHDYSKDGVILSDFESSVSFNKSGNISVADIDSLIPDIPQGTSCFNMMGSEPGGAYWLGGFAAFSPKSILGTTYFPFDKADTATTYVNLFIYGYGYTDSYVTFSFVQDDNGDGVVDESVDGSWGKNVSAVTPGWQKISFPLSELTGSGSLEINKLLTLYVSLTTIGVQQANIGCAVDFIIITQGKPL